jgi:iron(III) transport system substrate-binding protein
MEEPMRTLTTRRLIGVAACTLALAACGGNPTAAVGPPGPQAGASAAEEVYARFNALTGPERLAEIEKAAKEEGQLSLYTSLTSDSAEAVEKAFESRFGIEVSVYRASSESVLQRVQSEQRAGYGNGNDVLELNGFELAALDDQGYLAQFEGASRDAVVPEGQRPGWTASRLNRFVVSRNTDRIPDSSAPRRFDEFADPAWRGQLSIEQSDVDWFMALYEHYTAAGMSEEEFLDMFRRVVANSKVVSGHAPQIEQLSAGQFGAALATYDYQARSLADRGAPVSFAPMVNPVVQRPNGVAMMKSAPHPAAAYLFYEWLLTDGQQVLQDAGLTSSRADAATKGLEEGVELVTVDVDELLAENKRFADMYQRVLTG